MILERPGLAADRLQMAGGIFEEVFGEAGHERNRVGESAFEERVNGLGSRQGLKLSSPRFGRNRVTVKLPSTLGSAISMYSPRGQMCRAFFSI